MFLKPQRVEQRQVFEGTNLKANRPLEHKSPELAEIFGGFELPEGFSRACEQVSSMSPGQETPALSALLD